MHSVRPMVIKRRRQMCLGGWQGRQIRESTYLCRSTAHFVGLETTMKHVTQQPHSTQSATSGLEFISLFILEFLYTQSVTNRPFLSNGRRPPAFDNVCRLLSV